MIVLFKAFSALLSYPSTDMLQALPEIAEIVRTSALVEQRERQDLLALIDELGQGDLLTVEERYVDLFDRGRALSLNLFEHLHGESRDRGTAMVDLKRLYQAAGFELATRELPDYLPVVLEYLSCREVGEARALLADCAHIMKTIARSLIARQSRYAAVPQALIAVAGERPVDSAGIKPVREPVESLDRDWAEMPAFASQPPSGWPGAGMRDS